MGAGALAVMDNIACGAPVGHEFRMARTAIAELIEAHRRLLDYVLSEAEARNFDPPADTAVVADSMAALARVQGR